MNAAHTAPPMTAAEEAASTAWEEFAEAQKAVRDAWIADEAPSSARRKLHETAMDAYARFEAAYDMLCAPKPPTAEHERNRLACEGVLLVSALAAFVGLFLPDLIASFWPLAVTFIAVAGLGGWTVHFLGRLGQHLGRPL